MGRPPIGTTQTLREGLRRPLLVFIGGAAFTIGGVLMVRAGGLDAVVGVLVAVFFGICTLVGGALLAGGGRKLRLDDRGLQVGSSFGRVERIAWHDITVFSVHRVGTVSYVAYGLVDGAPPRERRARGVIGSLGMGKLPDGMLPTLYGRMSAKVLAEYLNAPAVHSRPVRADAVFAPKGV
jgi:hypothetical protein